MATFHFHFEGQIANARSSSQVCIYLNTGSSTDWNCHVSFWSIWFASAAFIERLPNNTYMLVLLVGTCRALLVYRSIVILISYYVTADVCSNIGMKCKWLYVHTDENKRLICALTVKHESTETRLKTYQLSVHQHFVFYVVLFVNFNFLGCWVWTNHFVRMITFIVCIFTCNFIYNPQWLFCNKISAYSWKVL